MGLLHNSKIDDEKMMESVQVFLSDDEEIKLALKQIRDLIVLTNKRIIIVDKQGITGRKKFVTSYLLNRMVKFEFENSPYLDIDSEVAIYFTGMVDPLKFELSKSTNILEFSKVLFEQIRI